MSAVSDISAARLERWQREVNSDTIIEQQKHITALESVLRQIVNEYDQTYDGEPLIGSDRWVGAASIPVSVMEQAKELIR